MAKWSVTATGDALDWSKTSFAEVAEWTTNAAGDVAGFTVEAFNEARSALETGAQWVWQQLAEYLYETLPELGRVDPQAREVASYLITQPVAESMEQLCKATYCVITFGIKLKALSSLSIGLYVCGEGWGFFLDSRYSDLQKLLSNPNLMVGVSAQVSMLFGPVSRASGAKAIKLGLSMKSNPKAKLSASVGGVILMEADMPPLFLGLRYSMDLDLDLFGKKKTVDEAGKLKWKVSTQTPKLNGEFASDAAGVAELGWEELTSGLSGQATNFDAALRAQADPEHADRIQATALAGSMSPFKPRYFGEVRTLAGQRIVGTSQGALGLDLSGDRPTVQLVMGLTDPSCVSFETVGEPPLYWNASSDGSMSLIPYDKSRDLSGTTFRMLRGLAGQGASFAVAADGKNNPRHLVATRVLGGVVLWSPVFRAERMNQTEGPSPQDATFMLNAPMEQPEALSPILLPGQFLRMNAFKRSANGMFSLLMANNGRLVMRQRWSGSLTSPTAWMAYEPGMIQDEQHLWAWASPQPSAQSSYYAVLTHDGRLEVRAGTDPSVNGAVLWQTDFRGAPGPCFMVVTNQGVVMIMRGKPDAPGEAVWTSVQGPLYWPVKRRLVALRLGQKYISAAHGGGIHAPEALTQPPAEPVTASATYGAGWETFELQDLCDGSVALRAQGGRFVCVQQGGTVLQCEQDKVDTRERFQLELIGDGNGSPQRVRLTSRATGRYISASGLPTLSASADFLGAAVFDLIELEQDLVAHSGRLFHILSHHSGKALEVPMGRKEDGLPLAQGAFNGGDHQKWIISHVGGGTFSVINHLSGRGIDVTGAQAQVGAQVIQWPWLNGANQRFYLTPLAYGAYGLVAAHSGMYLEIKQASLYHGAPIVQATKGTGAHQRWRIVPASPVPRAADATDPVLVSGLDSLMRLERVRLQSWKGDYLRRMDGAAGVKASPQGELWKLSRQGNTFSLCSSRGDFVHRPDWEAVTTSTSGIGNEWTLETRGSKLLLRSWKGDYLHRIDNADGITVWGATLGSEWTVEALLPVPLPALRALDSFRAVVVQDAAHLVQLGSIRLRSWKGDYLKRAENGEGVTSSAGGDVWRVSFGNGKLLLCSTLGDYLHRPNATSGVTTWGPSGGNEWILELKGPKILLRSWKGDYLHRPDSPEGISTWSASLGSEWTVEAL
ncbi:MAG: RICIN domain-containing protein [Myxococcota bacterium]